jgi:hypothetical protein
MCLTLSPILFYYQKVSDDTSKMDQNVCRNFSYTFVTSCLLAFYNRYFPLIFAGIVQESGVL